MELAEQQARLAERGLATAAISYDSVAILKDFATRREIPFPLLSDPGSEVIRAFGLLNDQDYPPGHEIHGVPYPGTLVIDKTGRVVEKYFEEGYRPRRTVASALLHSGDTGAGARRIETPQFVLTTSVSDPRPFPGNRITLALDFEMADRHHAYAPADNRYRALELKLLPNPLLTPHETVRPEPTLFHFAPLDETVPVHEGRFRLLRDVTLAAGRPMAEALAESSKIVVEGSLEYQVCNDRVCFPPSSMPLSWTLDVRPLDGERVPEALRKP